MFDKSQFLLKQNKQNFGCVHEHIRRVSLEEHTSGFSRSSGSMIIPLYFISYHIFWKGNPHQVF